jgi:hypothetical protein
VVAARKKPDQRTGAGSGIADDPRFLSVTKGASRATEVPIPDANPSWLPAARSWFNSLALSGQSEFYEASDWSTAVLAAQIYDMFLRSHHANLLPPFERLSARLGVTLADRKRNRIELNEPDVSDVDEEAADQAVVDWHGRLGIVRDTGTDG